MLHSADIIPPEIRLSAGLVLHQNCRIRLWPAPGPESMAITIVQGWYKTDIVPLTTVRSIFEEAVS